MFQNPLSDIVNTQTTTQRQSRIPFVELCGFYAALRWDVGNSVIARASGLSLGAVAHLRSAGTPRSGPIRYPKVAAEYAALGREAFSTKYLTPEIKDRLRVANDQAKHDRLAPKPHLGVNPVARKYAGLHRLRDRHSGREETFEIKFIRHPDNPGWAWRDKYFSAANPLGATWRGDPRAEERRFATSKDAYDFCLLRIFPADDQIADSEKANDDSYFYAMPDHLKYIK